MPVLSGLHHVKIPVADLEESLPWYRAVLGATHLHALDHVDPDGKRFAALLDVPGLPVPVELRWAPIAAERLRECDVAVFAVDDTDDLGRWAEHLDALSVGHSPVLTGPAGSVLVMADPDGKYLRLMTALPAAAGAAGVAGALPPSAPTGPWLDPPPMRHPRPARPTTTQETT